MTGPAAVTPPAGTSWRRSVAGATAQEARSRVSGGAELAGSDLGAAVTGPRRVAMVTGAARGIGQGIATALAADGWDVALVGRSVESLAQTATALEATGARTVAIAADVSRPADVAQAVAGAELSLGPLEALVNSAGVQRLSPALEVTEQDWDDIMDANLKGAFFCSQAAGRVMVPRQHGAIVSVASAAALVAFPDRAAYSASKAGLVMLTRTLALEWAPHNVRVNAVAPTFVDTELGRQTLSQPGLREQIVGRIPLGRIAAIGDVVSAVRFLLDPAASGFVTGHVLPVDGGLSL